MAIFGLETLLGLLCRCAHEATILFAGMCDVLRDCVDAADACCVPLLGLLRTAHAVPCCAMRPLVLSPHQPGMHPASAAPNRQELFLLELVLDVLSNASILWGITWFTEAVSAAAMPQVPAAGYQTGAQQPENALRGSLGRQLCGGSRLLPAMPVIWFQVGIKTDGVTSDAARAVRIIRLVRVVSVLELMVWQYKQVGAGLLRYLFCFLYMPCG